jgi:hypothetical protein
MSGILLRDEKCPTCKSFLIHFILNGEDVFGCPKCKKEIGFWDSEHIY